MTIPSQLSPDYRFLAVIGHPIQHSFSPVMHNTAFQALGLNFLYASYDIEPSGLKDAVHDMKKLGFAGFNVTLPHKETIIPLLDELDFESKSVGAVNTVTIQKGRLIGYNTDVYGALKSLEPHRQAIEEKKVLVLGSGGASRAVLYALKKYFKPPEIVIAARSQGKANSLAAFLKIENATVIDYSLATSSSKQYSLIVNATPVGMFPKSEASPLSDTFQFVSHQIVFDLIYRPLETTLLKRAKAARAKIIRGLEMFIHQGAKAFEIWTGERMPVEEVRKALEEKLVS
ncbi:MAG: shikimate dehydrogenase [Ignavibacteriales bacterium]|nr:shikimate dehydrogenase [Ignavibacteriales bacterium]